jgi:hypothetical protein
MQTSILADSGGVKDLFSRWLADEDEAIEPHMDGADRVYSAASEMRADGCALAY